MARSVLEAPQFRHEAETFVYVEARLWPNGPVCPHRQKTSFIGRLKGKTTCMGLHKCYACQKPFTVQIGTIFQSSQLELHLWLQIIFLMCTSTRQIQRMLDCSMKTAWFLGHRFREAIADNNGKIGGLDVTVEADETCLGKSFKIKLPADRILPALLHKSRKGFIL